MGLVCADWITADDLRCDLNAECATPALVDYEIRVAVEWMADMTCSRWPGPCSGVVIRPHAPCGHSVACGCTSRYQAIDLSRFVTPPVVSVDEVIVAGEVIGADYYRLDDGRWFTPTLDDDGEAPLLPWPVQDLRRNSGAHTWSIEVTHGELPPLPVRHAAAELASQLVDRACGRECDLPDNATSITRQGVTVNLAQRAEGRIGVPLIDAAIEQYGCAQGRQPRRLHDPAGWRASVTRT